jgi:hypothetical protein
MSTHVLATITADPNSGEGGMDLLRLDGLEVGITPHWFRQIVERDFDGMFYPHWLDHPAMDKDTLVVEPYDLSHDDMRDLLSFADRYRLSVHVSAISSHYPTRTLAVFLTPNRQVAP